LLKFDILKYILLTESSSEQTQSLHGIRFDIFADKLWKCNVTSWRALFWKNVCELYNH